MIPCVMSLWPGLPRLWRVGSWYGLAQALGFAFLLQLTVVTSLIWTETLGPMARAVVWFFVLVYWLFAAGPSFKRAALSFKGGFSSFDREHLFQAAQKEYLRGNWQQAEQLLGQQLAADAGDVEARLYLATLFRHIGRHDAAREQLDHLEEGHGWGKWTFEVIRERAGLAREHQRCPVHDTQNQEDVSASEAA